MLFWDIPCGFLVRSLREPLMLLHHFGMAYVAQVHAFQLHLSPSHIRGLSCRTPESADFASSHRWGREVRCVRGGAQGGGWAASGFVRGVQAVPDLVQAALWPLYCYYCVFFFGFIEISGLPLVVVDLFHPKHKVARPCAIRSRAVRYVHFLVLECGSLKPV